MEYCKIPKSPDPFVQCQSLLSSAQKYARVPETLSENDCLERFARRLSTCLTMYEH